MQQESAQFRALEAHLAYEAARTDIEYHCSSVAIYGSPEIAARPWWNISTIIVAHDEEDARGEIDAAVGYLDARRLLNSRYLTSGQRLVQIRAEDDPAPPYSLAAGAALIESSDKAIASADALLTSESRAPRTSKPTELARANAESFGPVDAIAAAPEINAGVAALVAAEG